MIISFIEGKKAIQTYFDLHEKKKNNCPLNLVTAFATVGIKNWNKAFVITGK